MSDYLAFTIAQPPTAPYDPWHEVHDFARGWGYTDGVKYVFLRDVERFLPGTPLSAVKADPNGVHARLEPLLAAEGERLRAHLKAHPVRFTHITTPRFAEGVEQPMPDIREVLSRNSIKDML